MAITLNELSRFFYYPNIIIHIMVFYWRLSQEKYTKERLLKILKWKNSFPCIYF